MTQKESAPPAHTSTGDLLRRTRIQQGLTVEEVAARLYLVTSQVESMENDRYDLLPSEVFVKGFLRNYAKLLELDADAVIRGYSHQADQIGREAAQSLIPAAETPLMEHNWRNALWGALALVILIAAASYFYNRPAESLQDLFSAPTVPTDTASLEQAQEPVVTVAPAESVAAPAVSALEATSTTLATVATASDPEPTVANAPGLDMQFSGESWVEVLDADQQVLIRRMAKAGDAVRLDGTAPFQIKLGNGAATRIQYHGNAVDIPPQQPGTSVRLTVGP